MISLTCVSPFLYFIMNILLILKLVSAKYVSNSFKPVTKLRSTSVLERVSMTTFSFLSNH